MKLNKTEILALMYKHLSALQNACMDPITRVERIKELCAEYLSLQEND